MADGKLRSIGLSNDYEPEDFYRLVNASTIVPVLIQNETHPYHQSAVMKEHIAQYGTVMESWFPLGGRGTFCAICGPHFCSHTGYPRGPAYTH